MPGFAWFCLATKKHSKTPAGLKNCLVLSGCVSALPGFALFCLATKKNHKTPAGFELCLVLLGKTGVGRIWNRTLVFVGAKSVTISCFRFDVKSLLFEPSREVPLRTFLYVLCLALQLLCLATKKHNKTPAGFEFCLVLPGCGSALPGFALLCLATKKHFQTPACFKFCTVLLGKTGVGRIWNRTLGFLGAKFVTISCIRFDVKSILFEPSLEVPLRTILYVLCLALPGYAWQPKTL